MVQGILVDSLHFPLPLDCCYCCCLLLRAVLDTCIASDRRAVADIERDGNKWRTVDRHDNQTKKREQKTAEKTRKQKRMKKKSESFQPVMPDNIASD